MTYSSSASLYFYHRNKDEASERFNAILRGICEYNENHIEILENDGDYLFKNHDGHLFEKNMWRTVLVENKKYAETWIEGCTGVENCKSIDLDLLNLENQNYLCDESQLNFIQCLLNKKLIDFARIRTTEKNRLKLFRRYNLTYQYIGYKLSLTLRLSQLNYFSTKKKLKKFSDNLNGLLLKYWVELNNEDKIIEVDDNNQKSFLNQNDSSLLSDIQKLRTMR